MSLLNFEINHQRNVSAITAIFWLNTNSYRKYIYIYIYMYRGWDGLVVKAPRY